MKTSVTQWLDVSAVKYPDKDAFIDKNRKITFAQLCMEAKAVAAGLIRRKIKKQPIVVYMEKGVDVITAFMGIAYSGNFYSPIDVTMPINRINKILEILQPSILVTTKDLAETMETFKFSGEVIVWEDAIKNTVDENELHKIQKNIIDTDLLYVLFTSGSTGTPKGVSITHRSVIDYIECVTDTFLLNECDSFGNQAPFYFDNSILDIYCTIKNGASCYVIPQNLFSQPALLLKYLYDKKINTIFWVPSALIVISKVRAFRNVDLSKSLKRVLFCGEVMPNKHLNTWRAFLPDVQYVNLYGPTEITDACTYYIVNRLFKDDEPLPIGIPMANTDILVLNEQNELVEIDEIGELCVRGTSLSMGYYRNPQKTQEVFVQNPLNDALLERIYRTGDLVKYNQNGELIYVSRKDFQIKHLGHRIELGEVETAVSSIAEISLCCCLYDEKHQKIVLFIDAELKRTYIIDKISKLIPSYMYPNKVIIVKKMPINANGKIDRTKLKEFL